MVTKVDNPHQIATAGLAINALFMTLIRFWPKRTFDKHRFVYVNRIIYVCLCLSAAIVITLILARTAAFSELVNPASDTSTWAWIGLVTLASHLVLLRLPAIMLLRVNDESFASAASEFARVLDDYDDPDQDNDVVDRINSLCCRFAPVVRSYDLDIHLSSLRYQIRSRSDDRWGTAPVVASKVRACVARLAEDTRSVFRDFDQVLQLAGFGVVLTLLTSLAT